MEEVRDLVKKKTFNFSMGHYLDNLSLLTRQVTVHNYTHKDLQRLYLKDIDCPPEWHAYLENLLPPFLFYLKPSKALGRERQICLKFPSPPKATPSRRRVI